MYVIIVQGYVTQVYEKRENYTCAILHTDVPSTIRFVIGTNVKSMGVGCSISELIIINSDCAEHRL